MMRKLGRMAFFLGCLLVAAPLAAEDGMFIISGAKYKDKKGDVKEAEIAGDNFSIPAEAITSEVVITGSYGPSDKQIGGVVKVNQETAVPGEPYYSSPLRRHGTRRMELGR